MRRKFFSDWLPPMPHQASAFAGPSSEYTTRPSPPPAPPQEAGRGARASLPRADVAASSAVASSVECVVIFDAKLLPLLLEGGSAVTSASGVEENRGGGGKGEGDDRERSTKRSGHGRRKARKPRDDVLIRHANRKMRHHRCRSEKNDEKKKKKNMHACTCTVITCSHIAE